MKSLPACATQALLLPPLLVALSFCPSVGAAEASIQTTKQILLSVRDWQARCMAGGEALEPCLIRLLRPPERAGRGGAAYRLAPLPPAATLSRAGVLFTAGSEQVIASVREDSSRQTVVTLREGAQCISYASPAQQHELSGPATYEAFLRVITDDPTAQASLLENTQFDGKPSLIFTDSHASIIGAQLLDQPNHAIIWAACSLGENLMPETQAKDFFRLILGSARRY